MKQKILSVLAAVLVLTFFSRNDALANEEFSRATSAMGSVISSIEVELSGMEKKSTIEKDTGVIDRAIYQHASETKKAYDLAMRELKLYTETEGKKGRIEPAQEFEKLVKEHLVKAEDINLRLSAMYRDITEGKKLISEDFIKNMTKAERKEFRARLTPEADKIYKEKMPRLFFRSSQDDSTSWLSSLSNIFIPNAEAALVGAAVACCMAGGCAACIPPGAVGIGALVYALKEELKKCKGFWAKLCKTRVWIGFLAAVG